MTKHTEEAQAREAMVDALVDTVENPDTLAAVSKVKAVKAQVERAKLQAEEPKPKPLKRYKIIIHSEGDGGDRGDVFIGHNYKLMQIQRDKEVEIDENFLAGLKGSIIHTLAKGEDDKMHPVTIPRYNYTIEPI